MVQPSLAHFMDRAQLFTNFNYYVLQAIDWINLRRHFFS